MKHLDALLELADKEFDVLVKNGKFRSREEIDTVYKLVDIVKDVYCIWKYEGEGYGDGSSGRSYDYDGDSYDGSYTGSYAKGRKRDSMGRYSGDGGKEEYMRHLRSMADEAPDERTRNAISRMIREM